MSSEKQLEIDPEVIATYPFSLSDFMLWIHPKQSISPRPTLACLYHACAVNSARDIYSSH